jgi:hypothetical protein
MNVDRLVLIYGTKNVAFTQKERAHFIKEKAPSSKHVNSFGLTKNMVIGLSGAQNKKKMIALGKASSRLLLCSE